MHYQSQVKKRGDAKPYAPPPNRPNLNDSGLPDSGVYLTDRILIESNEFIGVYFKSEQTVRRVVDSERIGQRAYVVRWSALEALGTEPGFPALKKWTSIDWDLWFIRNDINRRVPWQAPTAATPVRAAELPNGDCKWTAGHRKTTGGENCHQGLTSAIQLAGKMVKYVATELGFHFAGGAGVSLGIRVVSRAGVVKFIVSHGKQTKEFSKHRIETLIKKLRSHPDKDVKRFVDQLEESLKCKGNPSIWSSTKSESAVENAYNHWKKHGSEFPGYPNSLQYVEGARRFISNPPPGTLIKIRPNGEKVFYNTSTNTFAVQGANGVPKTMFKPDPAKHGFPTNLEYFNAQ